MKVSLVTVVLNNAETIENAITSVAEQTYQDIEYIIVDGESTDGTLDIIKRLQAKYPNRITRLEVGKDKGIYDAMNKGLSYCTGDVIGILNSDDFYADNEVIADVVALFQISKADTTYADLQYVDRVNTNKVLRHWKSGKYNRKNFLAGWMPPHPTFFVKRSLYEQYGKFDLELRSAADYELMLRFLFRHQVSSAYLPRVVIKMRVGGLSNQSVGHRLKANNEDKMAWQKNGLKLPFYTIPLKPLRKLPQFILGRLGLAGKF
jgi:glycosyltransferase